MTKRLKIAVIGAGKLGARHAAVYSKLEGVELVGVCDTHIEKAEAVASASNSKAYTDYKELLSRVDAASIVVPSSKHFAISKDFILKGVHLLIEKPITTTVEDADELLRLAAEKNVILQVGHIERFNSAIRTIKDVIKKPRFIEAHRLGPYDPRVSDVSVTLDLMIHDIDIVMDLVKSPIKSVDAVGAYILSKYEDISNARIRFQNNCVCDLTASRVTPEVMRKIRIFQDDAYISIDYVTQEVQIYTKDSTGIHHKKIDITRSDSLREELSDFIQCIHNNRRPVVSGEEGRNALALALQISRQIREGHEPLEQE